MNTWTRQLLFWMPRLLGILFALFLSLFALDVFNAGYGFAETLLALLMHLIPTGLVVISLAIAWRWEWIGATLFIALACIYLAASSGGSWIISGPLFLLGILFLLSRAYRPHHRMQ